MTIVFLRGVECPGCGHRHVGVDYAGICIGCPCELRGDAAGTLDQDIPYTGPTPEELLALTSEQVMEIGRESLRRYHPSLFAELFTCPRCGAVSGHPDDAAAGYCGRCHDWTGERS